MSNDIIRRNAFLSPFGYNPLVNMFSPRPMSELWGDNFFSTFRDVFDSDFGVKTQKTDEGREYRFALPGVSKENINIDVDGDVLVIEVDEKSDTSTRKYSSRVTLAPDVDKESLKAKYVDGMLTILAPQLVNEKKKVSISWEDTDTPAESIESSGSEPQETDVPASITESASGESSELKDKKESSE